MKNIRWVIYLFATDFLIIFNYVKSGFLFSYPTNLTYIGILIFFLLSIIALVIINLIELKMRNNMYSNAIIILVMLMILSIKQLILLFLIGLEVYG